VFDFAVLWIQANLNMQYFDEAAEDFRSILELEPDNRIAKHQLAVTMKNRADGAARERSMFAGMFHKFAQQDLTVCFILFFIAILVIQTLL